MKIIYETVSIVHLFTTWALRILFLIIIGASSIHFFENPIAISLIVSLFLVLEIIITDQKIKVYEDKFVFRKRYFFNLYTTNQTYFFKDIKAIETDNYSLLEEIIISTQRVTASKSLYLHLKNDKYITINTDLNELEIEEVTTIVNKLLDKNMQ